VGGIAPAAVTKTETPKEMLEATLKAKKVVHSKKLQLLHCLCGNDAGNEVIIVQKPQL